MRLLPLLAAACGFAVPSLRAADPVISEFMADNAGVLADEDGQNMDWIEVYNPGPGNVNLAGWSLTDDSAAPQKWVFPAHTLNAGQSVVVWASGKNRTGAQLHTNFSLNDLGEYLALVKPDGTTRTSEWNPYPPQQEDVSYGMAQQLTATALVTSATGSAFVPGAAPDAAWNTAGYTPGGGWITTAAPPGLGYDTTSAPPAPANIASSAAISQSTTNGAFAASLAVNGVTTDFTHTLGTDAAPFWNADFGTNVTIHSITVRNRGDGCCQARLRDITIAILDATMTPVWTSVLLNPENTGFVAPAGPASLTVNLVTLTGAPVSGRHVRVSRTADPDGSGNGGVPGTTDEQNVLSMSEVEITGLGGTSLINLARSGVPAPVAAQSSNYNATYVAGLGINGVTGNSGDFTHTINTDLAPWWQVNLQRRSAISRVDMQNRVGCCPERLRDLTLTILDTNGTTVLHTSPLLNPANALGSPAVLTYDVAAHNGGNPVFGQYVKISRTRDAGGGASADDAVVISFSEVLVMGTELNGYRAHIRTDVQTPMKDLSPAAYWRLPFTVASPAALTDLSLRLRYDDGFVAYLNGTEVARRNAPASPGPASTATADRLFTDGLLAETISLNAFIGSLHAGSGNVLALHGLNSAAGDDNFLLQPELTATALSTTPNVFLSSATPGALNNSAWYLDEVADTVFSHRRGFYDAAFNLTISTATADAQIYYTTNNSEPTPANGTLYTAPIAIGSTPNTPTSGARVIRARAFKTNWKPTNTDTHTYIFLNDVTGPPKVAMSTAGAITSGSAANIPPGWPTNSATNGGQAFVWGFDAGVKALYTTAQMRQALTQIPAISVVTAQQHLTDPVTGIYVNGTGRGDAWERPASIEMLDFNHPGATPEAGHGEFGENCGLRIRGGASRGDSSTKHSFRVFFRKGYGNGRLNYRLYGANGAASFENFDLRGSQNYSWSQNSNDANETMIRDPFCRMTLADMGQPSTRTRFCHLFLNGLYWGIYDIHERAENSFGESYLGGDKTNFDVIKCGDRYTLDFKTEATDGYLNTNPDGSKAAWRDLWDRSLAHRTAPANENYFRMLGRNPDGTRNPAYPVLVDVDDLIDYMMVIFYSGDGDAVLSNFLSNNKPNNWHSMRDRTAERGFTFYLQDGEHTLLAPSWNVDRTGPWLAQSNSTLPDWSNPQWIHDSLALNPEYRLRFADRVRKHFFNGGALSAAVAKQRWLDKAATINTAIRAYAARYSTTAAGETAWNTRINFVRDNFFDARPATVLAQFSADGLWPSLAAADFSQHGGSVPGGYALTMNVPSGLPAGAQIYYTLDGSDPRRVFTEIPTPLTYVSATAATRYYVTTGASGGDNGFTSNPVPPPSPGPVSRYPLDGNANDTAGGGNHGTLQNAPVFGTDRTGAGNSAIVLNGSNQAITLGDPANLQITGPITIAAWINPASAAALRNIVNKGHNTTGVAPNPVNGEITLRLNTGASVNAGSWDGSDHLATLTAGATLNTWQHFASVYDGSAWRLYKNGVQVASTTDPTGAVVVAGSNVTFNAWNIGSRGGSPAERPFHGSIDDVAIFNRGLSAAEVLALYNPAATLLTPDWKETGYPVPASWGNAAGGIGYDAKAVPTHTPYIATAVPAMQGASATLLTRRDFSLTALQIADTGYLQLNVRYDDGFIAYLNGTKIAERNAPASPAGNSAATAIRADAAAIVAEKINITAFKSSLVPGNNVLAIHGLNATAADNDFLLEASLTAADNATAAATQFAPGAQLYTGPLTLNSPVTVQTRVLHNGQWSPLTSAFFSVATEPASASNLVISEIHYHPENPVSAAELAVSPDKDDYEFIEIMNISPSASVDLTGIRFTAGITTAAPGNQVLPPGGRAVFVKNLAAFEVRYGTGPRVLGIFTGNLNNQGEQIILNAGSGAVIRDFVFDDNPPWPEAADGAGFSLCLLAPLTNPDHALSTSWRGSSVIGGSPASSSFTAWKSANGITANTADGDGDGLDAVLEYALGANPAAADDRAPQAGITGGFLTFTLTHRDTDDALLTPQISSDLNGWSSSGITLLSSTPQPGGLVITVWQAPVSVAAGQRLYFRGLVTLQ